MKSQEGKQLLQEQGPISLTLYTGSWHRHRGLWATVHVPKWQMRFTIKLAVVRFTTCENWSVNWSRKIDWQFDTVHVESVHMSSWNTFPWEERIDAYRFQIQNALCYCLFPNWIYKGYWWSFGSCLQLESNINPGINKPWDFYLGGTMSVATYHH